jgi:omega-hydroxy-beta-dihydromenaquinone-9 sulfotransferase
MNKTLNKPIILLGMGRSGTSIVADIILNHQSLSGVSNYHGKYPLNKYVNFIRLLSDNKLYKILGQKQQLNNVNILQKYAYRPSESYDYLNAVMGVDFGKRFLNKIELSDTQIEDIRAHFSQLTKYQFKERLGFKITGPSRIKFLHQIFPNAQYINITRNPLPNLRSLLKVSFYKDRKHQLWWQGEEVYNQNELLFAKENSKHPEFIAALQYYKIRQMHLQEIKLFSLENNVITIKFEDFIKQPEDEIQRILDFTGLKKDRNISKFMKNNKIFNQNKKNIYFFSKEMDSKIMNIAINGIG